ncbi:adenylate kinase [Orbilia oligospora]|nr:adenylate kinase [Orbilia oligospora]KAF3195837.1 adenylate kinase [Orbilia oligospora]KAF3266416.1 adenylate kinase [Orbilia oligospora]KAF3297582.1 adenylate kinase [Orbilia oligospora]
MDTSNTQSAGHSDPPSAPMDTSELLQEASRRLNVVPIPGSVATNNIDAVLEGHSLMTTKQAYDLLRDLGVPRDVILSISQYGQDQSRENNDSQTQQLPQQEKDVQDLVSLLFQRGWERNYPHYVADTSQSRPPNPSLMPMINPVHYNDLDSNILRYAPHLRPENIIPPMAGLLRQNPQTLQVSREPGARDFKDRDPSIVIVYIVGPPGSGKTEVAKAICGRFNFHYLGVAEILQQEREDPESPYRDILNDMLPKGLLGPYKMVPSMLISEIVKEMSQGFKQVFVIDGFPRGLDRAQYFESVLQPCDQVIEFLCDDEIAFNRMMSDARSRMTEPNLEELAETFNTRLKKHRKEVAIVTHYYRQLGKVMSVDAEVPFSKVMKQMELKLKDLVIDGYVGNRKETVDERNQKAWQEMKKMVEQQFMNRAYSLTALAAREGYDPTIDDSGADEEMDDVEEEDERDRADDEEEEVGAGSLNQSQNDVRLQQASKPAIALQVVPPHIPPQTAISRQLDYSESPQMNDGTNKGVQGVQQYFTINQAKVLEKADKTPEKNGYHMGGKANDGTSCTTDHSSDELESDSSMRTKNAGKTPGPKQTQNSNRNSWPSGEPLPPNLEDLKPLSPKRIITPTSSSFAKRLKSIRRKISGTLSSGSESGASAREKLKAKLSLTSLRRRKKSVEGEESEVESEGLGGMNAGDSTSC